MVNKKPSFPPRCIIAGTHSGCGKTTITTALMSAFSSQGKDVVPCKVGPDFIDPSFHEFVTGNPSCSLDAWLLPEETVKHLFVTHTQKVTKQKAPLAIIEGVMGLYDGHNTTSIGSTAHIAHILHAPTILVVDGQGMSLSIAALISGYTNFYSERYISGVIFNKLSGKKHYKLLSDIVYNETGIPCFGFMPRNQEIILKRRHLGLVPSYEVDDLKKRIQLLTAEAKNTLDLNGIARLAESHPLPMQKRTFAEVISTSRGRNRNSQGNLSVQQHKESFAQQTTFRTENSFAEYSLVPKQTSSSSQAHSSQCASLQSLSLQCSSQQTSCYEDSVTTKFSSPLSEHDFFSSNAEYNFLSSNVVSSPQEKTSSLRIGVLKDKAFSFYYHDNLELLQELGAELVYISPLKDVVLPESLDGLYIGGGFPEIFAHDLSANTPFRTSLYTALAQGLPAYAECGGMMYLMEEIVDIEGKSSPMVGFFEGKALMTKKRGPFGYITVELLQNSVLGTSGTTFRAHEFHHSRIESPLPPVGAMKKENGDAWQGGMIHKNVLAWYPHIHFYTLPELAKNFLAFCAHKKE